MIRRPRREPDRDLIPQRRAIPDRPAAFHCDWSCSYRADTICRESTDRIARQRIGMRRKNARRFGRGACGKPRSFAGAQQNRRGLRSSTREVFKKKGATITRFPAARQARISRALRPGVFPESYRAIHIGEACHRQRRVYSEASSRAAQTFFVVLAP